MTKKASYEDKLTGITDNNAEKIKKAYLSVVKEISTFVNSGKLDANKEFSFKKNPTIEKKVDAILKDLNSNIYGTISTGINSSWDLAVEKNNEIAKKALGKSIEKLPSRYKNKYLSNNQKAKQGFVDRKVKGLGLSDRIWNNTGQFKAELELALELSIGSGKSAAKTVKDIKQYLNEPDKLYRRVRDEKGNLRLSKAAQAYHPGQGRYRSSYKNSQRLARNEINFSYEKSNQIKTQQQDFVVGIEIRVSKNHSPKMDLGGISCDSLQGKYPKNFDFSNKWHVNCRCVSYTILKTPEEIQQDVSNILSGGKPDAPNTSSSFIPSLPNSYIDYVKDNVDKWKNWSNQPRFIELNKDIQKTDLKSVIQTLANKTKEDLSKIGMGDEFIYRDPENPTSKITIQEFRKKVGSPIATESIYGKPNISVPREVKWEQEDILRNPKILENITIEQVKITDIEISQRFVFEKPLLSNLENQGIITLFEFDNKYYLLDGNHRVASAFIRGDKTIKAKVVKISK